VECREGTVENVEFIAYWNGEVYDVIFAIVRNVYAVRGNVQLTKVSAQSEGRRTLPYDLTLV